MADKNYKAELTKNRNLKAEAMAFREKILKKLKNEKTLRKAALLISEMIKNTR